jgi:glycosyltransferase involved in cell wall biosynthesis
MIMMDDAWERTDCSDALTGFIKRLIHRNIDGAFIPAPSHRDYYRMMGFSEERIVCGVDVVDNDFFSRGADEVRRREEEWRSILLLPKRYFLFVGRFLRRKGIEDLIDAYVLYRNMTDDPWDMVLVGAGPEKDTITNLAARIEGIRLVGPKHGDRLCLYYALAAALVVPSRSDPWGLVVNEGMASGLPVIVSRGCGAAMTLVREGENGWAFDQCDRSAFAALLHRVGSMSSEHLRRMGDRSRALVAEWGLDTFVQGVLNASEIPRRPPGGFIADIFTRLWKGRVALT